ncbi:MAG: hypothetical protein ABFD96_01855, partial [Armatimonadia bacterium]
QQRVWQVGAELLAGHGAATAAGPAGLSPPVIIGKSTALPALAGQCFSALCYNTNPAWPRGVCWYGEA